MFICSKNLLEYCVKLLHHVDHSCSGMGLVDSLSYTYVWYTSTCSILTYQCVIKLFTSRIYRRKFHYLFAPVCEGLRVFTAYICIRNRKVWTITSIQQFSEIWLINCANNLAPDECLFTCRETDINKVEVPRLYG